MAHQEKTQGKNPPEHTQVVMGWVDRWCQLNGLTATPVVYRKYAPMVAEFMEVREPTMQLLQSAKEQGIKTPAGWAFVQQIDEEAQQEAPCDRCESRRWILEEATDGSTAAWPCPKCRPKEETA